MPGFEGGRQSPDDLETVAPSPISSYAFLHDAPPAALCMCAMGRPIAFGAHLSAKKSPAWQISVSDTEPSKFLRGIGRVKRTKRPVAKGGRISSPILEDKSLPSRRIICEWLLS